MIISVLLVAIPSLFFLYFLYTDIKSRIISDNVLFVAYLSTLTIYIPINYLSKYKYHLYLAISLAVLTFFAFLLLSFVTNIGGGDIKLMPLGAFCSGFFGFNIFCIYLYVPFLLLVLFYFILLLVKKKVKNFPFAPFLFLGLIISFVVYFY